MTGLIVGVVSAIGGLLLIVVGYLIKGAIAYFGKKGAQHVYDHREEYKEKGKRFWDKK